MYISKIGLENFRNYEKQELNIAEGLNIFIGNNAQGKTNVIESIYVSSIGKSFRTNIDREMIKMNMPNGKVQIEYFKNDKNNKIDILFEQEKTKQVKLNGIKLDKLSQVVGNVQTVLFSPDELQVLKQLPGVRRKFFDISISQTKPMYVYYILEYNKVLKQRNALLKQIKYDRSLIDTIDIWDEKLVNAGMLLINNRTKYVEKINEKITKRHLYISDNKEELILKYIPSCKDKTIFERKLKDNLDIDIQNGYTGYGPHKDDYSFYINGILLNKFGSQGQQRSGILSYKLAEIDNLYEEYGEKPILLLDDVTSELDKNRIEKLLENIAGYQTIITCTDIENFKVLSGYKLFNVESGKVMEV